MIDNYDVVYAVLHREKRIAVNLFNCIRHSNVPSRLILSLCRNI